MKSLSVGVRSVFSDVNCRSKFDTSLRCFCGRQEIIEKDTKKGYFFYESE